MERIVTQTIPAGGRSTTRASTGIRVTNAVTPSPAGGDRDRADGGAGQAAAQPEVAPTASPTRATRVLLADFRAAREAGRRFAHGAAPQIDRRFELDARSPRQRVRAMLTQVLESPLVPRVAALIEQAAGPQAGAARHLVQRVRRAAAARGASSTSSPASGTRRPRRTRRTSRGILQGARLLAGEGALRRLAHRGRSGARLRPRAGVRPARRYAAGRGLPAPAHARRSRTAWTTRATTSRSTRWATTWSRCSRSTRWTTRCSQGVPNTAFTEALAFVFQAPRPRAARAWRKPDARGERARALNDFWDTWEIAGVALVDMDVWHWMYEHPDATPAQLRDATVDHRARLLGQVLRAGARAARQSAARDLLAHDQQLPLPVPAIPSGT